MAESRGTARSSYRFTPDDLAVISALATHHGISETDALRLAVRSAARQAGLAPPEKKQKKGKNVS